MSEEKNEIPSLLIVALWFVLMAFEAWRFHIAMNKHYVLEGKLSTISQQVQCK